MTALQFHRARTAHGYDGPGQALDAPRGASADDRAGTADSIERMMGTKAEARFAFISDKAEFAAEDLPDI
jgi:hypothetical protein